MKKIVFYLFIIGCFVSCKEDERPFSIEPYIELRSLKFIDVANSYSDTLKLEFYIKDVDSDLGLDRLAKEPFNPRDYYYKSTGEKCSFPEDYYSEKFKTALIKKLPELITYKDSRSAGTDTLPKFVKPFNCTNWEVLRTDSYKVIDTVYFRRNLNYYNIYIDFYSQANAGWELFDFNSVYKYPLCDVGGFYGRFLPIDDLTRSATGPFLVKKLSTSVSILTFNIVSVAFKVVFPLQKIKLRVSIQDRALHKSNEIETPEIQL